MLQALIAGEEAVLLWIQNNIRSEWLNPFVIFITNLGNGGFIWLLGSVLIDNVILKNVIARTRPYETIVGLTSLVGAQKDYSFPSGHTGSSFVAAVVLFRGLPKKYGIPALLILLWDRYRCGIAVRQKKPEN